MATLVNTPAASFDSFAQSSNANSELLIHATKEGQSYDQTVPIPGPGVLFFDQSNSNFFFLPDNVDPNWAAVETISGVTP